MRIDRTALASFVVALSLSACGGGGSSAPVSSGGTGAPTPSAAQTTAASLDFAGLHLCEKVDLAAAAKVMGTKIGFKQDARPGDKQGVGQFAHPTSNYVCELRQSEKGKGIFPVLDIFLSPQTQTETDFKSTLVNVRNNQAQGGQACSSPPVPDLPGATASALFVCTIPYVGVDLNVLAIAQGHRFGCDLGRPPSGFDQAAVLDFCQKTYAAIFG